MRTIGKFCPGVSLQDRLYDWRNYPDRKAIRITSDRRWPLSNESRLRLFLLILTLLAVGRMFFFRPGTDYPGAYYNRGENAVWLGIEWVNDTHTLGEIEALAKKLKQHQIRYVFVFTSYLKPDGEFNPTYAHAATFIQRLKAAYPEVVVLAWLGLPLTNSDGFDAGYVDLEQPGTRSRIAVFSARLLKEANFDGVHLDPEPVFSGDANVLALLEEAREAIGSEAILSIATRRIVPLLADAPVPFIGQVAWRASYYREIANRVDQIAVMTYDSALPTPGLYQQFVRFQVIQVSRAVDGTGVQLLIGIPSSEEKTRTHNPAAENITSGLRGVIAGLNDAEARPENVSGVAVYPYWEMDETEWKGYASLWLGLE